MSFQLKFTEQAEANLKELEEDNSLLKRFKAVRKALGFLETNPRHPGLNTHKYSALSGLNGEEVFEAYAENKPPPAYRIFWLYGPEKKELTNLHQQIQDAFHQAGVQIMSPNFVAQPEHPVIPEVAGNTPA